MHDGSSTPRFRDLTLGEFGDRLSSADPVPGGGSASAVVASLAAALVAMVAALSEGRPKYGDYSELLALTRADATRMRDRFLALADEDAEAYGAYAAVLKLPKDTDDQRAVRAEKLKIAARRSAEVPLTCLEVCLELVSAAEALAGRSNVNASSDLTVASLLAEAAARGAAANVLENLPAIGDPGFMQISTARTVDLLERIGRIGASAREAAQRRESRPPLTPVRA
ncbi:MAG TPA: cyclodeaminase/cyclohydrolase family protein [Candidatus Limnocylindrales bacterium]